MFSKALTLVSVAILGGTVAAAGCSSSSSGPDTEAPVADSGADSKAADAAPKADTGTTFDSGTGDDSSTASGCTSVALDLDGGNLATLTPATLANGSDGGAAACSMSGDLAAYFAACFSPGSATECPKWAAGSSGTLDEQSCGACINANVLIGYFQGEPNLASINDVACISATDTSAAGQACAQADLNLQACLAGSCQGCTTANDPQGAGRHDLHDGCGERHLRLVRYGVGNRVPGHPPHGRRRKRRLLRQRQRLRDELHPDRRHPLRRRHLIAS